MLQLFTKIFTKIRLIQNGAVRLAAVTTALALFVFIVCTFPQCGHHQLQQLGLVIYNPLTYHCFFNTGLMRGEHDPEE